MRTLILLLLIVVGIAHGSRFNVVGSQNQEQYIRLKSQYDMEPGKVLKLPIDVPKEYISLLGTLAPRLLAITSPNEDNVYGTGDIILIDLEYTIDVYVHGAPTLTLNTGCESTECKTKEIQSFVCAADTGMFAMRLEDQFLMNIAVNTTKEELKKRMEEFVGVETVTITYGDSDDRRYSGGNRACTSIGNTITVVFDKVSFPQYDGDVPPLMFDRTNTYADRRGGLNIGMEETFLGGVPPHSRKYVAVLTPSTELVKGVQQRDGTAYYVSGNGTNVITFAFKAQDGDFTDDLEVKSLNFDTGYIFSPITLARVSTDVPPYGAGPRYMSQATRALGFERRIAVSSAAPQIISLTSPNADGTYTQGDVLTIHIVYDLPVKTAGAGAFTLQLSTGAFDREIPFIGLLSPTVMQFQYTVQEGDVAEDLDVIATTSLALNGGAIYRDTSTNETLANITLPFPGALGSLSANKDLVINTLSPQIVDVSVVSRTGVYTGGDLISFQVRYGNPIAVQGTPRLLIRNTPVKMDVSIRTAPYAPEVSYTRGQPGQVIQTVFSIAVNWDLAPADRIVLSLPGFSLRDPTGDPAVDRVLSITATATAADTASVTTTTVSTAGGNSVALDVEAEWDGERSEVVITTHTAVARSSVITFAMEGRSGLVAPATGVVPAISEIRYSILSPGRVEASRLEDLPLDFLAPVGFESLSLSIAPATQDVAVTLVWTFKVPERLVEGDTISLFLPGFLPPGADLLDTTSLPEVWVPLNYFNFTWLPNSSEFRGVVTENTPLRTHTFALTDYFDLTVPPTGVGADTVTLSANMANNGVFDHIPLPTVSKICAFTPLLDSGESSAQVLFETKLAGATSAAVFEWQAGPSALVEGDKVVFVLPEFDSGQGTAVRPIADAYLSGDLRNHFSVAVQGATVTFTVVADLPENSFVQLRLSAEAGLMVPVTGIRRGVEQFTAQIVSPRCAMTVQTLTLRNEALVIPVTSSSAALATPGALLGEVTALDFQFRIPFALQVGDTFTITIPGFSRLGAVPAFPVVTSNAALTTKFSQALQSLQFTVIAPFSAATTLLISVNETMQFAIPTGGISTSAFQLSVNTAANGAVNGAILPGPCLGFCSADLQYSTYFEGQAVDLTAALRFGETLTAGQILVFNMAGFELFPSVPLTASVYTSAANKLSVTPALSTQSLSVTLPLSVPANTAFYVEIFGFALSIDQAAAGTATPSISVDSPAIGGTAQIALNYPDPVLIDRYFTAAELEVEVQDSQTNLVLVLRNPAEQSLVAGNFIGITLPGITWSLSGNLLSTDSAVDTALSTWDTSSSTALFVLSQTVDEGATLRITLNDVTLPVTGLSATNSGATYTVGVGSDAQSITVARPFTAVQGVVQVTDATVALTTDSAADFALTAITVSFTTAADLTAADSVTIELPGLSLLGESSTSDVTASLTLLSSTLTGPAVWQQNTSSVFLQLSASAPAGTHTIVIDAAAATLVVLPAGVSADTVATFTLRLAASATEASGTATMPCIGVCRAVVTPTVRKAGFPTEYAVNISLGLHDFVSGDKMTLALDGFTGLGKAQSVILSALNLVDNTPLSLNISLSADSVDLEIQLAANESALMTFRDIFFLLPQEMGIKSPPGGVRAEDRFVIAWEASLRGTGYTYSSNIVQVMPVGKILSSSLEITPRLPGAAAEYAFSFAFADPLLPGDELRIYLPSFTVPSGELDVVPALVTGLNLTHVRVVGVAAGADVLTNVDNSKYLLRRMAFLQVTVGEAVYPDQSLQFAVRNSSLLLTPRSGICRTYSVPWVSIISETSPVAATQMQNYTRLGSLSPAALTYLPAQPAGVNTSTATARAEAYLRLSFSVNCPLFDGDSLSVHLPNFARDAEAPSAVNVTTTASLVLNGDWESDTSVLTILVANGTFLMRGPLAIEISLRNFTITTDIMYANDTRFMYSVDSELCPVDGASFDAASAFHLSSSEVRFAPTAAVDSATPVYIDFTPTEPLLAGDIFEITLPGFQINGSSDALDEGTLLRIAENAVFGEFAVAVYSTTDNSVSLYLRAVEDSNGQEILAVQVLQSSAQEPFLRTPLDGVDGSVSGVSISCYRNLTTAMSGMSAFNQTDTSAYLPGHTDVLFQGPVETVQSIWYFMSKSVIFGNPAVGADTSMDLQWSLSQPIPAGSLVIFHLPGVTNTAILTSTGSLAMEGLASKFFTATWDSANSRVILTAKSIVPRYLVLSALFAESVGFACPAAGVPIAATAADTAFSVSLEVRGANVLTEVVHEITVVPVVLSSSLSFIASDEPRSFEFAGDPHIMMLEPGHELNALDAGAQVVIDNAYYTIVTVQDNLLYLLEPYRGRRIFMGYPAIPVYTPPYRFAEYFSGSGTSELIFRYKVRRDDLSASLQVFAPTTAYSTNNATQALDLNGGLLLRNSNNPALLATIVMPSYPVDLARSVNTDAPVITTFFTTTRTGIYSVGQKIDFHVQYDYKVAIENLSFSLPILLLKVAPWGLVKARYASGSGTNTIVFVYTVSLFDFQRVVDERLLTTEQPIFQPLRVISGNDFNSLRRRSDEPLVNAAFDFPAISSGDLAVEIPANISLVGVADKIHRVWTPFDIIGTNFSAGDVIQVMATFTGPVTLEVANASTPYIELAVGRNEPGIALFHSAYNATTLTFTYEVTPLDELTNGLYLHCTCADYFRRTFLMLDGSELWGSDVDGAPLRASSLLANSSTPAELRIDDPNGEGIRIDRAVPYVVQVSSNLSYNENVPYSPGTVALISVRFNLRVTVRGILRLWLKGQNKPLPARYYKGNNTLVLDFLYVCTPSSGVSRLDYTDVNALDTSNGVILRFSDRPQIIATTLLPRPGLEQSLGIKSNNVIDTTRIGVREMSVYSPHSVGLPYFAADSLSLSLYRVGPGAYLYHSRPERRAQVPFSYLYENSTVPSAVAEIEKCFADPLDASTTAWSSGAIDYTRLILSDSADEFFDFTPVLRSAISRQALHLDSYWWTDVQVRSTAEFDVTFDRPALLEGASVAMNTGMHLNRAYSSLASHKYHLTVTSLNPFAVGSKQESYRISYGGVLTRCIAVTADAKSVFSLQMALEEIPGLRVLEPNVLRLTTRVIGKTILTYYEITFVHLPESELKAVTGHLLGDSCALPATDAQVLFRKQNTSVVFEYPIRGSSSILLQSTSTLPAGIYSLTVEGANGISVSPDGLAPHSAQLEKFTAEGRRITKAIVPAGHFVPKIIRSTLAFGANIPLNASSVSVSLCFDPALRENDEILVSLPNFDAANVGLTLELASDSGNSLQWLPDESALLITLGAANSPCVIETVNTSFGMLLPQEIIFRNSRAYTFSVQSPTDAVTQARIVNAPFELVTSVGISDFTLRLSDPRPGLASEVEITFEIETDMLYDLNSTVITVYLPGFYISDTFSGPVNVGGAFATHFAAEWVNATTALVFRPVRYLQKGTYSLTVLAAAPRALHVPQLGMFATNQPYFSFESLHWASVNNPIVNYPSIYGFEFTSVEIELAEALHSYDVAGLNFVANFSQSIDGPAMIVLSLPFLSSFVGKVTLSTASEELETAIWRDWEKTLTISRTVGWDDANVFIEVRNLTGFFVNELGVPEDLAGAGIEVAVFGANGHMASTEIVYVAPVPKIQHSSLDISTYPADIFNTTQQTYSLSMQLNTPTKPFDVFLFDFKGMTPLNGTSATISDPCTSLLNATDSMDGGKHTFVILLLNGTECRQNQRNIQWTITELYQGDASLRTVAQYKTDGFYISWQNQFRNVESAAVSQVPTLGITYSSIEFANPYAGTYSDVDLRVLTATAMRTGDLITVALPHFGFNWTSTVSVDNYGRLWPTEFDSTRQVLLLSSPTTLPPTALQFVFRNEFQVRLPARGIEAPADSIHANSNVRGSGNITIGLSRSDLAILPQPVQQVTPVGKILSFELLPRRAMKYDVLTDSVVSKVNFTISLSTLSALHAGDRVLLELPHYSFHYNESLNLAPKHRGVLQGRVFASNGTIEITVMQNINVTELDIVIVESNAVAVGDTLCNQLIGECPVVVSVLSTSNPVRRQSFMSSEVYLLADVRLRFYETLIFPTFFPTGAPSSVPSGQPSRRPSSQPSGQPTGMPVITLPTSQPSSLPSAQPSTQPSALPTCEPSAQPSMQPTSQPSALPTSPTSQPSTQPSSQPSTQPSSKPSMPTSQPSSEPSSQPSSLPSCQPSTQPSSVPTVQPSSTPSGQPSSQPSSQPTVMPTEFANTFALIVEVSFTLQNAMYEGGIFAIHAPNLFSNLTGNYTTALEIVLSNDPSDFVWDVVWLEPNRTIQLVAMQDIEPGPFVLKLISYQIDIASTILYENDPSIAYEIQPFASWMMNDTVMSEYVPQSGSFASVTSYGLKNASLAVSTPRGGEEASLLVELEADASFESGDRVTIHLPGFTLGNGSMSLVATTNNDITVSFDSENTTVFFHIHGSSTTLRVELSSFIVPVMGSNDFINEPTVEFYDGSTYRHFTQTPFLYFTAVAHRPEVNVSFSVPRAGLESDILIEIANELHLAAYDTLSFYLPQFWSTRLALAVSSPQVQVSGHWDESSETMVILILEEADLASLELVVTGMHLPIDGVSIALRKLCALSSNSTRGGAIQTPHVDVQLVGYVMDSSLLFAPALTGVDVEMTVSFVLNIPLTSNDTLSLSLPGFALLGSSSPVVFPVDTSAVSRDAEYLAYWDAAEQVLTVQPLVELMPELRYTFMVNDAVRLPAEGVYFDSGTDAFADTEYTIGVPSAIAGTIGATPFAHLQPVGLSAVEMHYHPVRDANDAVSLRLKFHHSSVIVEGDTITFIAPLLTLRDDVNATLTIEGDLADNGFQPAFSAVFDNATQELVLTAIDTILPREVHVFVKKESGLVYTDSTQAYASHTHFVSASIASIGELAARVAPHSPNTFFGAQPVNLNISACTQADTAGCSWTLEFELFSDLQAGESLALTHPSLVRTIPPALPTNYSAVESVALEISGTGSSSLAAFWRSADNVAQARIASGEVSLITEEGEENPAVHSAAVARGDVSCYPLNLTLPMRNFDENVRILPNIPKITNVYATHRHASGTQLTVEDALNIYVEFSDAVAVLEPQHLRLLLNTGESAAYKSGNESHVLHFIYRVTAPLDVASLEVLGPGALEFSFSAPVSVFRYHPDAHLSVQIPANLTIPAPYGPLLLQDGSYHAVSVAASSTVRVTQVVAYTKKFATYATGDILDVLVTFDRAITVLGSPVLMLSNETLASAADAPFAAQYVNVSSVQWLDLPLQGVFSLSYEGHTTACFRTHETTKIRTELAKFPGLALSLPIRLDSYAVVDGWRYRLQFGGIAPHLLKQTLLTCPEDEIRAKISMDSSVLNSAIFRYEIVSGDDSELVNYANTAALLLGTGDSITIAGSSTAATADLTLPPVDSAASLASTSGVRFHTAVPYVVSVTSTSTGAALASGEVVDIVVTYSAPVLVTGTVQLKLNFSSTLTTSAACCAPIVTAHSAEGPNLYFSHTVQMGDFARYLETDSDNTLYVTDGSILLLASIQPSTLASLTLPGAFEEGGLNSSMVFIDASTLPVVLSVFTNHTVGSLNAGDDIFITIRFSSAVEVVPTDPAVEPFITLESPAQDRMTYIEGSGTADIVFLYQITAGHSGADVSFMLNLESGAFRDPFQRSFTQLATSPNIYIVTGISIDSASPSVLLVDSTASDGTYYPGDLLDVFVVFSEPVYILGGGGMPALELLLPSQIGVNLLAYYSHGNGTNEIHFSYDVPPPNFQIAQQAPVRLNYASTNALYWHMNGTKFTDVSSVPTTEVDVFLPNQDNSYLAYERQIYLDFTLAQVVGVAALSPNGIYTTGDEILLKVQFSSPVMVILPPVLKLHTGAVNRSAVYVRGNFTTELVFQYNVQLEDRSPVLDYIDTRLPPYNTETLTASFALNTEVRQSAELVKDAVVSIFLLPTQFGGVFMASRSPTDRVAAYTALPVPGATGSISASASIVIDTSAPFITLVTVPIASGTYGKDVAIPITVTFSAAVVVSGCPTILFQINGVDKFATYKGGSDTTVLHFEYIVLVTDSISTFDYFDRFSLKVEACNPSQLTSDLFIKRKSLKPQVFANLTMPWVNYIESVIAPVSISGSGKVLNLDGQGNAPRLVWTSQDNIRSFALGDVIDINVGFTSGVLFPDRTYLRLSDAAPDQSGVYTRSAYFAAQINATTINFPLVVQHLESIDLLSYLDPFSLLTETACSIINIPQRTCAAQNLPVPYSQTPVNSIDAVSVKNLTVTRPVVTVHAMEFADPYDTYVDGKASLIYPTGTVVNVTVTFSDPVIVRGTPMISLQLEGSVHPVLFVKLLSPTTLLFQASIDSLEHRGKLVCTHESAINLNGGSIYREANFLPLLKPELTINAICCQENCGTFAQVLPRRPVVTLVTSPQSGVFSSNERVDIFVHFSAPLRVIGNPALELELTNRPVASFVGLTASGDALSFSYMTKDVDYTSALDYVGVHSLYISSTGLYDGIYLDSLVGNITADLTLPERGAFGSLGRSTTIVINKDRPNIVTAFAEPAQSTSGDDVRIILRYSEFMRAVDGLGEDIFTSGNLASGLSSIGVQLTLRPTVESPSNPVRTRVANLLEVIGTDVVFVYAVTADDPTGTISFSSTSPLSINNVFIESAASETDGPIVFPASLVSVVLATIDNDAPVVVRVFSPGTASLYPYGVGDVIDIYVEMSLAVIVAETPTLDLILNGGALSVAVYKSNNAPSVQTLHFQYTVRLGDSADPLEYDGRFALHGLLLRFSTRTPSIVADLQLPPPFSLGSLGSCCNVVVDSLPPYIESLIPLKLPGIYGENEVIYIMARFNKPVTVEGIPALLLTVSSGEENILGQTSTGTASYVATVDEYDIPIDIRSTDVLFKYTVRRYDNVLSLRHQDENAIFYPPGAVILHATNSPSLAADVTLRDPNNHVPIDGRVHQQWKFRYPASVEILLRDLYHTKPNSITASVEHLGQISNMFAGCCQGKTFGNSYPKTRSGTNATLQSVDTGVGDDFLFSDMVAPNIARLGIVSQSSTRLGPKRAIDGNVDPLVGDGSVSETTEEDDAWWQVALPANSQVRSLTIWARKPQSWVNPIAELTIKSFLAYPEGKFRLRISNIDESNPTAQVETEFIQMGTSAENMQRIVEATPGLGNVAVTRRTLPLCIRNGQGCGQNYQSGNGFAYRLSFLSLTAPTPEVTIFEITFPGQAQSGVIAPGENVKSYQLFTSVELIRSGYYIQIPEELEYGKGVIPPVTNTTEENTGNNFNAWLTPFWVFLFGDVVPPTSLNASANTSIWFQRYENMGDLLNINLPSLLAVKYVKIQREGYGSLSLAELEVYEERINNLNFYNQGSPLKPSALTAPYQPLQPFQHTFNNLQFDGRWLVQLEQDAFLARNANGWSGALGSVSEAVLIITDMAGVVHSYYQDLRAEVTSLPKYGDLTYTVPYSPASYANWRERFEVGKKGELIARPGGERSLGFCYGPHTSAAVSTQSADNVFAKCPNNFGVAPLLNSRVLGDTPETVYLRNERVVVYKPRTGYLGPDYFTYIIFDGLKVQEHEYIGGVQDSRNEVSVHVRKCRPFQSRIARGFTAAQSASFNKDGTHVLCGCAQTEAAIVNNRTACDAARTTVCSASASSSGTTNSGDAVSSREHFMAMCLSCMDPQRGLQSGDCQTQTIRAVSLLTSRGLCVSTTGPQAQPFMDCSTESVTEPGREATNYLSLKPPILYGGFERLKNSFGAYGWYHTPLLN